MPGVDEVDESVMITTISSEVKRVAVEAKLRQYILENYLFTEDQSELDNDDSFLEEGILDSTGIMELIYFLEDAFNITVADEEMLPENLDSVNKISRFCAKKGVS